MSELSFMGKLMQTMELSKTHHTGLILTYFDILELTGEIESLKGYIAELDTEVTKCHELQDSYCDRIAELEGLVERLIELGDVINGDKDSVWTLQTIKECWTEDVTKWKERE